MIEALFAHLDTLTGALNLVVYGAGNVHRYETMETSGAYF